MLPTMAELHRSPRLHRLPSFAIGLGIALAMALPGIPRAQQSPAATSPTTSSVRTQVAAGREPLLALLWMQRGAEYKVACLQAYHLAQQQLQGAVEDPGWTACLEQGSPEVYSALPAAVVVDVDETVLDNSAFAARQIRAGITTFDPVAWSLWVHEQQALPIPGALSYLTAAVQLGVRVIYITNRKADGDKDGIKITEEADTRGNLARLGFPILEGEGEDVVLCAGEIGDKAARRREVCKRYRVVALVGDNLGDFTAGTEPRKVQLPTAAAAENAAAERIRDGLVLDFAAWWGTRWFLIPNPSYGGWETVLRGQYEDLADALRTQR
jgi:5'-nucleotidase (lipoprotein e(P4) family)